MKKLNKIFAWTMGVCLLTPVVFCTELSGTSRIVRSEIVLDNCFARPAKL